MTLDFKVTEVQAKNASSQARVVVNRGGTRCFHGEQMVCTKTKEKPIKAIKKGDFVLSYNIETRQNEYKKVVDTHKMVNTKKTVKVKLKNGTVIIATEDHEFFYKGEWTPLKDILHGRDLEENTGI